MSKSIDKTLPKFGSCIRKKKFASLESAMNKIYQLEIVDGFFGIKSYHCGHCNFFHLGHPPKRIEGNFKP